MKKFKKIILIILCIIIVLAIIMFFIKPSPENHIKLETAKVELKSIKNSVTATGTVEPVTLVTVGTQVSGIIDRLYADYNDVVKAGQILAVMDKVTLEAELQSAQSTLESNKTEYEYRLKEYNRVKKLYEKELVSEKEFDEVEYYYKKAKNSYDQANASLVKVKRNLSYATISSPIDGVVISRAVEEGQTVASGFETPTLFTIAADLTKMRIIANVDEADIGQVVENLRVEFTVDAYPDDIFEGRVDQVRLEATTSSNVVTYEVVVTAENPDLKLKPGLTASVTFYTEERDSVAVIPSKALKYSPDSKMLSIMGIEVVGEVPTAQHVWVLNNNVLMPQIVQTGSTSSDVIEVLNIELGTTVVVGVTATEEKNASNMGGSERSPFMLTPPGQKKK